MATSNLVRGLTFLSLILLFSAPATAVPTEDTQLYKFGQVILDRIHGHESKRDATCWSTVRMMEDFYARKDLSEEAVQVKIESVRALFDIIWTAASRAATGPEIQAAELSNFVPAEFVKVPDYVFAELKEILPSPEDVKLHDYHIITEHMRVMLSLIYEQISGQRSGVFLKPFAEDAIPVAMNALTGISIGLLREASQRSTAGLDSQVEPRDIAAAYTAMKARFPEIRARLAEPKLATPNPGAGTKADQSTISEERLMLYSLTKLNIENKIRSLNAWNGRYYFGPERMPKLAQALTELSDLKVEQSAVEFLVTELRRVAALVAKGGRIMRADSFPPSAESKPGAMPYLTLNWVEEAMREIFPHQEFVNGDIELRIVPSPAAQKKKLLFKDEQRLVLRGYDLDAIRDTSVHWIVLSETWSTDQMLPIEPFAAELLAERLSQYGLYVLRQGEKAAKALGKNELTGETLTGLFDGTYNLVKQPPQTDQWPASLNKKKQELFKRYDKNLYTEVSDSGIGTNVCKLADSAALVSKDESANQNISKDDYASLVGIQQYMGSGVAVADINNDNLPDLFLAGSGCSRLYKNLGNSRFEDITEQSGIVDKNYDARQALLVDVNNDSLVDLFVPHSGSPSKLFIQDKDGKFNDRSAESGIVPDAAAHTAVFFDYDNDSLLDLYLGSYGTGLPALGGQNAETNKLFKNLGEGRFKDVTEQAGVGSTAWTLAVMAFDYNNDSLPDLFLANDFGSDQLFENRGDGTFREVAGELGVDDRGAGMNVSLTDVNHDGNFDVYVSVIDMFSKSLRFVMPTRKSAIKIDDKILKTSFYLSGNKLFVRDREKGGFAPEEERYFEPGDRGWGWSANFFDYENDGDDDMYLANGWIKGSVADSQKNQFFIQDDYRFFQAPAESPEALAANSRAVANVDLTASGYADLVVTNFDAPTRVFKNNSAKQNKWLKLKFTGSKPAVGTVVRVFVPGLPPQTKLVSAGSNYLSQDEQVLTFGLGQDGKPEKVMVRLPGEKTFKMVSKEVPSGTVTSISPVDLS